MFKYYELVLKHYITDGEEKRFSIEEPIVVTIADSPKFGSSPIIISQMFDAAKSYVLERMKEE